MKKVNIGFIGAGSFISCTHLPTAAATGYINIAAIAELDDSIIDRHKSRYDVGYFTKDYKDILKDPAIDIVVIGTKQDMHAKLIIEALDAGKWVWCEKPMCETDEEALAIIAAEERNPGRLAIGFNRRFAPGYTLVLEELSKRPRPWFVTYRVQMDNFDKKRNAQSFYFKRPAMVYEGCHFMDLASFIFKEAPRRVYMSGAENAENDCIILEYKDGSRFQLLSTNTAGNGGLGKEFAEFFAANFAAQVDDFTDVKLRGDYGVYDKIIPPAWGVFNEETLQYGYDFVESLRSTLAQPEKELLQARGLSLEKVVRGHSERPYEAQIDAIYEKLKDRHWTERVFQVDKGWEKAFQHFARAFLEQTEPYNADGKAGKLANDIAYALLESKKQRMPVEFNSSI